VTSTALQAFLTATASTHVDTFGQRIRIDAAEVLAAYSAPRLMFSMGDSGIGVERYTSILRVPKSAVPTIRTARDWLGVTVELPEDEAGNTWRTYEVVPEPRDVRLRSEWRVELRALGPS